MRFLDAEEELGHEIEIEFDVTDEGAEEDGADEDEDEEEDEEEEQERPRARQPIISRQIATQCGHCSDANFVP